MSEQRFERKTPSNDNRMVPGSAREVEFRARNRAQALRGSIDLWTTYLARDPDYRGAEQTRLVLTTADTLLAWLEK